MATVLDLSAQVSPCLNFQQPRSVLGPIWEKVQCFVHNRLQQIGPALATSAVRLLPEGSVKKARLLFVTANRELSTEGDPLATRVDQIFSRIMDQLRNESLTYSCFFPQDAHLNEQQLPDDGSLVMSVRVCRKMAEILLLPSGTISRGLVSDMQRHVARSHAVKLGSINDHWQTVLNALVVPRSQAVQLLIRVDLGLLPDAEITLLDCKKVVLAAALGHSSGPDGLQVLEDLTALCRDGYLTRRVDGRPEPFFFVNTLDDDALKRPVGLKPDGTTITSEELPIWLCPNLIAACKHMNRTDVEQVVRELLTKCSRAELAKITWDDLIQDASKGDVALAALGRYAFSSTQQRLLSAYEAAKSSFPEVLPSGCIRRNIHRAVRKTLQPYWNALRNPIVPHLCTKIQRLFTRALDQALVLVYNRQAGKMELYTEEGNSVELPEDFQELIQHTLQATILHQKPFETPYCLGLLERIERTMCVVIRRGDFMDRVLKHYDPENKRYQHPAQCYQELDNTPMTSRYIIDGARVRSIDMGGNFDPDDPAPPQPKDPYDWLKWMMGLADWEKATQEAAHTDEGGEMSVREAHVFTDVFSTGPMSSFLNSNDSVDVYVERFIATGRELSSAPFSIESMQRIQQQFVSLAIKDISNLRHILTVSLSKCNESGMTVQQFAQCCFETIVDMLQLTGKREAACARLLDRLMIEELFRLSEQAVLGTIFPFAPCEQHRAGHPLYFCAYFNVRTETLQLGVTNKARTLLQPISERASGCFFRAPKQMHLRPWKEGKLPLQRSEI